jgi:hypothetical protein
MGRGAAAPEELPGGDQQKFCGAAVFFLTSLGRYNLIIAQNALIAQFA